MNNKRLPILLVLLMLTGALLLPRYQTPAMGVVHQHLVSQPDQKDHTGFQSDGSLVTHLPILILHTEDREIPGLERRDPREFSCAYTVMDSKTGLNSTLDEPTMMGRAMLSIRGNSSRDYPKAQYTFKTVNAAGEPEDVPMLGMPAESVWVINGSYIDHSQLRNYMLYNLSGEIMHYAPRCRLCEVFTTDAAGRPQYQGLYTLIEKIKVSDVRLDLKPAERGRPVTSFMAQMNSYVDNTRISHLKPDGMNVYSFDLEYPDPELLTEESRLYIERQILTFEKAMNDAVHSGTWEDFNRMVDLDSFVDYYLINEFFQNLDAGTRSTYLHQSLGGKISIGPVWDFDGALNNYQDVDNRFDYLRVKNSFYYWALFQNPRFVELLLARYNQLRQTFLSEEYLLNYLDQCVHYSEGPALRNCLRWYEGDTSLYDHDLEEMRDFIRQRGKWMDENFAASCINIK